MPFSAKRRSVDSASIGPKRNIIRVLIADTFIAIDSKKQSDWTGVEGIDWMWIEIRKKIPGCVRVVFKYP
jgi:hypothetical protein